MTREAESGRRAEGGSESGPALSAGDVRLAALWLGALQRLVDRAAHEVNNALNGVVVNLEVVRVRATPGGDAGRVAAFAEAAAEQAEEAGALVGALVALARSPRAAGASVDVSAVARQVVALLAPAVAHDGVGVALDAADPAPVPADAVAVRAAVALALLQGASAAAAGRLAVGAVHGEAADSTAELGGANPANEPSRQLRCIVSPGPRVTVEVAQSRGIQFPTDAAATLRERGVDVVVRDDAIQVTFRAAGGGA